jgi:hypothetical protein
MLAMATPHLAHRLGRLAPRQLDRAVDGSDDIFSAPAKAQLLYHLAYELILGPQQLVRFDPPD